SRTKVATNFDFDGQTAKWSRWWAFIDVYGTSYVSGDLWNAGQEWNDGWHYDTETVSTNVATDLVAMFRDWQAAHSRCAGVGLVWQANAVGPTVTPTLN